ncbi:tRNA synthetases class II-domain-containing protein [Xylariaceae sp. FL0016]|nr:tRNA synthetases class II-domain-containing protein [Xylariaceae sp. FL0016]
MNRLITARLRNDALRCVNGIEGRLLPRPFTPLTRQGHPICPQLGRFLHDDTGTGSRSNSESEKAPANNDVELQEESDPTWALYKQAFNFDSATPLNRSSFRAGNCVTIHGFMGKRRDVGNAFTFCQVELGHQSIQLVSSWEEEHSLEHTAHQDLKSIPAYSPVAVYGTLQSSSKSAQLELKLRSIQCLNPFPKDIIVSKGAVWPPKSRHLQMRFDPLLAQRLMMRAHVVKTIDYALRSQRFAAIETPLLFKSTPEGAREFLVPTRRRGFAYALPQSPQQFKQILMAGGIPRYYQFARCFRDEDHRSDRQPEFTQLDLEVAFATGKDVRQIVEGVMRTLFDMLSEEYEIQDIDGIRHPVRKQRRQEDFDEEPDSLRPEKSQKERYDDDSREGFLRLSRLESGFLRFDYQTAMRIFGIDKPDLRIHAPHASNINDIHEFMSEEFIRMITKLDDPIVEACKFRLNGSPEENRRFIAEFFDNLSSSPQKLGNESTPGVFLFDSSKPLQGLSSLGHEAAANLADYEHQEKHWERCEDGDIIIIHARKNEPQFSGGSTELGRLRKMIWDNAVEKGLLPRSDVFAFCWIDKFPLFMPNDEDPGQGGSAGFSSTHHPFTAPEGPEDFDLLKTDPLRARADHYDLVLNGVELGGGSRRIHIAGLQEYIMRDILKMTDAGVAQFSHLIEALRAGCPPHAGFALGLDRLMAILCDVQSVKDVIAFPKNNKGEDMLVGSPTRTTPEQRKTYHFQG